MKISQMLQAATLGIALVACAPAFAKKAAPATTSTATPQEQEAAYTQTIEKRAQDILALLDTKDPAATAKVHDLIVAQYRALRDWHDANDPKLKELAKHAEDPSTPTQIAAIKASLKPLHDRFVADLSSQLPVADVDKIKDKMTYNKVQVTYSAYLEIVPNVTDSEKVKILEFLKEAREEAMDGGSVDEKSAIFKKYKGKIANYLNEQGHDVAKAYKDWGERQKAKAATNPTAEPVAAP